MIMGKSNLKISVLVPVYNVEKYLEQCLESIIRQTYDNLQIIIVNDGSCDGSRTIIDKYQQLDARIEVIHKENTGYGNSMNIGLRHAVGEYIGIVESDDFASADMYQTLAEIAQGTNADVIKGSNYEYTCEECKQEVLFDGLPCDKVICPREHSKIFQTRCHIWAAIYKRSFLLEQDIWFNETPGASYQDNSFSFKVWAAADTAYLIEKPLIYYRLDNATSSVKAVGKVFCILDEIREIDRYMEVRDIQNEVVKQMRHVVAYFSLRWNLYRLEDVVRYAFWLEMRKECERMAKEDLQSKYWPEYLWQDFQCFLNKPMQYLARTLEEYKNDRLDRYTSKDQLWLKAMEWQIKECTQIIIYGAGYYGRKLFQWFKQRQWTDKILGYAVTTDQIAEKYVEGIAVRTISEYDKYKEKGLVIVAVKEETQYEILVKLRLFGFKNVLRYNGYFEQLADDNAINQETGK